MKDIIKVYRKNENISINYDYNERGNRTEKDIIGQNTVSYSYYPGTNRLKENGKYAYTYDDAGNLVEKGNKYSINGETVTFTSTSGTGVKYYQYEYNLQNRLSKVRKNGKLIAEFSYDVNGMRIKASETLEETNSEQTTYYVYGYAGKVLMEESDSSSGSEYTSYIYAFGKTFARVDGKVEPANLADVDITYFHYDNLGSTRLMTDKDGKVLMDQDYIPFGGNLPTTSHNEVQNDVDERYKYTGQKEVVSIGLYYYGARYYDPSIGRFITEDTYQGELVDPQSQNIYVYTLNNPMRYVDPTGHYAVENEISVDDLPNRYDPSNWEGELPNIINEEDYTIEFGEYGEDNLKYVLIKLNLNKESGLKIRTNYTRGGKDLKDIHEDTKALITMNANYFGDNYIVYGDLIIDSENIGNLSPVQRWYFATIEDNGKQEFDFGRTDKIKDDAYAIAWSKRMAKGYKWGVGGIGPLLLEGQKVSNDLLESNFTTRHLGKAYRSAFGVNQNQKYAYVFAGIKEGRKGWNTTDTSNFLKKRGVHNGVFFDSGGSTGLIWKDTALVETRYYKNIGIRERIPSVIQIYKEKN